jgi:hypothetical protein
VTHREPSAWTIAIEPDAASGRARAAAVAAGVAAVVAVGDAASDGVLGSPAVGGDVGSAGAHPRTSRASADETRATRII